MTAPGAEIEEGHELVAAIDAAHEEVFGEAPGPRRDALVQRRVGAHALRHPDRELRHVDRADGRRARREPRDRRPGQDGARPTRSSRRKDLRMKLVTYDGGKVGRRRRRGDRPPRRHRRCASTSSAAAPTTRRERTPLADAKLEAPISPEEVLPHRRQLPRARGGVEERRLVAPDRAVDQLLPERRRDHRPRTSRSSIRST